MHHLKLILSGEIDIMSIHAVSSLILVISLINEAVERKGLSIDITGRNLMLITIGAQRVKH